jgi:SRSO17 transposase
VGTYRAFQHFIAHAPWEVESLWRRLREVVPERSGLLILDGTSFPKQGTASVGVARQYCGTRGKIANSQVAVTVALSTGALRCICRSVADPCASGNGRRSPRP